jgi:hypothetical protein
MKYIAQSSYIFVLLNCLNMSFKDKIMNAISSHPRLVTFGIGLGITFVIGTAIGMVEHNQAFALASGTNADGNADGSSHSRAN